MPLSSHHNIANLRCGEIGRDIQGLVRRSSQLILGAFGALCAWLLFSGASELLSILKIAVGAGLVVVVWSNHRKPGLPVVLIVAAQTLFVYAMPLITGSEGATSYPSDAISRAANQVALFCAFLAMGWKAGIGNHDPRTVTMWTFRFIDGGNSSRVVRLAMILIATALIYQIGELTGFVKEVLRSLPSGSSPILNTVSQAACMGGGLLGGFTIGGKAMQGSTRSFFWVMFWGLFALLISGYLLSNATGLMSATTLGLVLGQRKIPYRFLTILVLVCSFFNLTKFEMRQRYWDPETGSSNQTLDQLPERFMEWSDYSMQSLFGTPSLTDESVSDEQQQLSERIDNLTILLFVQDAVTNRGLPLLGGETYTLIPKLLIPRVFWRDKPRAHAGQELLNVHFGRQSLSETFQTYIAWGFLAEAYGNFGPLFGAIILGLGAGYLLGRVEGWSRPYPIKTMQAFVVLVLMVQIGTSFEMVASVFVTSTFQLIVAITGGTYMLVDRRRESSSPPAPEGTHHHASSEV